MAWHPLNTPLPVITRYGYEVIHNTERLTSIFNFGFGDLSISDIRIGASAIDQYKLVELHDSVVPPGDASRTTLTGYTSEHWPGNTYPGNVQTINGGALEQNPNVLDEGWIERQGSLPGRYIQIDIAGRLFRQGGVSGISNLTCVCEAEYQTPDSTAWKPFPFSPMTIVSGTTRIWRETFSAYLNTPAINFRVRRVTPESGDASDISEMEFVRVKVFRADDALYPAQRRQGLMIRATGQLNNRIERYSALVRNKCWVWNSSAPWDGSLPGTGAWQWRESKNPAWLFIYFARGGFLNPTAKPAHLGQSGWLDEPAPGNGPRLFGAGLTNNRIDYGTLVAWGQWCDQAKLEFRTVVTDIHPSGSVLDSIAAAGRARKTWAPGKLSVWWEAAGQPWLAAFGTSNIVAGTFRVAYNSDDTVDEFGVTYTQSDNDYEPDTVYATVPGVTLPVNQQISQAVYSMPKAQAQRLVNLQAAGVHYHRRTITWESTLMGLTVACGDIIQLAHDLTSWAYSGRLIGLTVAGGKVTAVELSAEVEHPCGGEFWLMITPPGGDPMSVRCAPPQERTRKLKVLGDWPASNAPGWLDASTSNPAACADWQDTIPEDWTYLGGPQATPGKRVRIIGMEPASARRVRITARDEYEAYYPLEWGLGNVPDPASGQQLIARAFNLSATPAGGALRLAWELEGAHGADVRVAVSGGPAQQVPVAGHITVLGRELLLPPYPAGTKLAISLLPVAAGTPAGIEGDSLIVEV